MKKIFFVSDEILDEIDAIAHFATTLTNNKYIIVNGRDIPGKICLDPAGLTELAHHAEKFLELSTVKEANHE